ncbi:MAG TPA: thiamine-phosphate kinase [Chloroflexota bacterium]|nr:thiamine-phosphate kinase [Chloroflexota bacterium]
MATRLADVGEFGLIDRIRRILEPVNRAATIDDRLEVSIGDDAAVWRPLSEVPQAITTDALVEGVHFDLLTTSWNDLGWKSLAVNLSDVGAMGADPELGVISLGLPKHALVEDIESFFQGIAACAARWRVAIVGGDIVTSPVLTINVTAVGACARGQLRRSAGVAGDVLAVTGWLGRSGGGLRLLQQGMSGTLSVGAAGEFVQAHVRPVPRIEAAACLVEAGLRCAMDVSDGLRGDTGHICEQSQCAATIEIDRIALHDGLVAEFGREDALRLALDGGEDYELLCAGPESAVLQAANLVRQRTGEVLTIIGSLKNRAEGQPLVTLLKAEGSPMDLPPASWDHFRD